MAGSVPAGQQILDLLRSPNVRRSLVEAAERGVPPVSAASEGLLKTVGLAVMRERVAKQFVGLVVRSVLNEEGFVLDRSGVRLRADPIFEAGSVYRRRIESSPTEEQPLLQRFADGLNANERRWLKQYLQDAGEQRSEGTGKSD